MKEARSHGETGLLDTFRTLERTDDGNRTEVIVKSIRTHNAPAHSTLANTSIRNAMNDDVMSIDPAVS